MIYWWLAIIHSKKKLSMIYNFTSRFSGEVNRPVHARSILPRDATYQIRYWRTVICAFHRRHGAISVLFAMLTGMEHGRQRTLFVPLLARLPIIHV